jgi:hypothetical protein
MTRWHTRAGILAARRGCEVRVVAGKGIMDLAGRGRGERRTGGPCTVGGPTERGRAPQGGQTAEERASADRRRDHLIGARGTHLPVVTTSSTLSCHPVAEGRSRVVGRRLGAAGVGGFMAGKVCLQSVRFSPRIIGLPARRVYGRERVARPGSVGTSARKRRP